VALLEKEAEHAEFKGNVADWSTDITDAWVVFIGLANTVICIFCYTGIAAILFPVALAVSLGFLVKGGLALRASTGILAAFKRNPRYEEKVSVAVSDQGTLLFKGAFGVFEAQKIHILHYRGNKPQKFDWLFVPPASNTPELLVLNLACFRLPGSAIFVLKKPEWFSCTKRLTPALVQQTIASNLKTRSNVFGVTLLVTLIPLFWFGTMSCIYMERGNSIEAITSLGYVPLGTAYFLPFLLSYRWCFKSHKVIGLVNVAIIFAVLAVCRLTDSSFSREAVVLSWAVLMAVIGFADIRSRRKKGNGQINLDPTMFVDWKNVYGRNVSQTKSTSAISLDTPKLRSNVLTIGEQFDARYEILSPLGEGGMGAVYKAMDLELQRPVAVKVLLPSLLADPSDRATFKLEGRLLGELSHENVVKLYRYAIHPNFLPYLIMEYVEGVGLTKVIARTGGLSIERTITLGMQLCDGLQAAHDKGIVHRDLKPSNVLVVAGIPGARVESVKIIDFGLAKAQDLRAENKDELLIGTATYMSPEQCLGKSADYRSDIYALGCILYEMLIGSPPFYCDNPIGLMAKHVSHEVPSMSNRQEIPVELERVILKAMHKNPQHRFESAREMRSQLEKILSKLAASPLTVESHRIAGPIATSPPPIEMSAMNSMNPIDVTARLILLFSSLCQMMFFHSLETSAAQIVDAMSPFIWMAFAGVYASMVMYLRQSASLVMKVGVPFFGWLVFEMLLYSSVMLLTRLMHHFFAI
jgi:serine/threonine protein kinase